MREKTEMDRDALLHHPPSLKSCFCANREVVVGCVLQVEGDLRRDTETKTQTEKGDFLSGFPASTIGKSVSCCCSRDGSFAFGFNESSV